jgi:hypothetical protein
VLTPPTPAQLAPFIGDRIGLRGASRISVAPDGTGHFTWNLNGIDRAETGTVDLTFRITGMQDPGSVASMSGSMNAIIATRTGPTNLGSDQGTTSLGGPADLELQTGDTVQLAYDPSQPGDISLIDYPVTFGFCDDTHRRDCGA